MIKQEILQMIEQAEQEIHQELQQIPRDDRATRAYIGMNRLTVLKNDIKELLEEVLEQEEAYSTELPIWFHVSEGVKRPATFLGYIGQTVQIQAHGSMYPQNVDISTISPRVISNGKEVKP